MPCELLHASKTGCDLLIAKRLDFDKFFLMLLVSGTRQSVSIRVSTNPPMFDFS